MDSFTALAGLRVLELSGDIAVAYSAKVLGEFGADVVKVEPPGGDWVRGFGPTGTAPDSAVFIYTNTGKRTVVADLHDPADPTVPALLAATDIMIGSASAQELEDRGLSPHKLAHDYGVVYVSIRPYGFSGPGAGRPGTELDVFHAGGEGLLLPGGLSYELFPDRPPVKAGRHLTDYDAGNVGAFLALALTMRRLETGVGAFADVSKQDVAISLGRVTIDRQLNQGIRANRADRGYDYGGIFPCLDGYITVRPTQDAFWASLATGIGRPDLVDDPRFATRGARETNAAALDEIIRTWCATRRARDIYDQLAPLGTPIGYYSDAPALLTLEHAAKRGDLSEVTAAGLSLVVPRPGYTFGGRALPGPAGWPPAPATTESAQVGGPPRIWSVALELPRQPSARGGRGLPARDPLTGIRVLDLTWVAAGPYTTELLSMLGAEVVKVESSAQPDLFRQMPDNDEAGLNRSARFNSVNLNKQSVGINLRVPQGRALLHRLAVGADLIVSNFRPGVLERLNLTYDDLKGANPDVVVVCISSAGRGGTDPGYAGYASIFNSMGGLGHLTGYADGPAVEVRDSVDLRTGTVAAVGALAALLARRRGGAGTAVDVSAQQAITGLVGDSVVEYQLVGRVPWRAGNGLYDLWPYGVFPCEGDDEWVAIAARDARDRDRISAVLGLDLSAAVSEDERRAAESGIATWTSARDVTEVVAALHAVDVPATKVFGGDDILHDEHVRERGLLRELDHPTLGPQIVVGAPWRIDGEVAPTAPAPALGQDTVRVVQSWTGLSAADIAELIDLGAVETDTDVAITPNAAEG
ncbi:CoA transferase [Acrocarpospora macrocephala]|uniref:CoA transferase n=1 Tax=Acrocarpospora macrocephala TaxID=150177 RepID=A0A5M3WHX8_9ACTN|nr:CoA transferase [Acrocarpospora macrocephala]GES08316.1 CoA transferase [Acrocarpospora macrocephala]